MLFRSLVSLIAVLIVSTPVAAQHQLWSATMTAGEIDFGEGATGVGYLPPVEWATAGGELSNTEFNFRGNTYVVSGLWQYETDRPGRPAGSIRFSVTPGLGELDAEFLTVTADGQPLELDRVLTNTSTWTLLQFLDPGFRWTVGQRVAAGLATQQSVPALPFAAAGLLALLLGAAGRYRRVARRR
jgi:hypothetical protein